MGVTNEVFNARSMLYSEAASLDPVCTLAAFPAPARAEKVAHTSPVGSRIATSLAGFPCRSAKLTRRRYCVSSGITNDHGLCALKAPAAYIRQPGSPASGGEYGQPCPTN